MNSILKKCSIILVLMGACLMFSFSKAQAQVESTFGKGLNYLAEDSSFSLKFSTRFQTLYQGNFNFDTDAYDDRFLVRRYRLKFDGFVYDPSIVYKLELGISNRDIGGGNNSQVGFSSRVILDAVVKWKASKHWTIWFGQTKLPGNRERVVSSQKLQFVDRSLLNGTLNIDRDIGVQFWHTNKVGDRGVLKKAFSISMGEGRNIIATNSGGYDYTFRFDYLPFGEFKSKGDYFASDLSREPTPKLAIGGTYDVNVGAVRQRGQLGSFMEDATAGLIENNLTVFFIDAMFKYRGFSAMAEYGDKWAEDQVVATTTAGQVLRYTTGNAFNFQAGYLFNNNIELAARYTTTRTDDAVFSGMRDQNMYTLGISKYIVGHNLKIQSDISYWEFLTGSDNLMYRFQIEVAL